MNIKLTDTTTNHTFDSFAPPFTENVIEGATDVVTLDNDISTYFTTNKRQWTIKWSYMSKTDYDILKGFYDRQFTLNAYPTFDVTDLSLSNISVRMYLDEMDIVDNCLTVSDVEIKLRES